MKHMLMAVISVTIVFSGVAFASQRMTQEETKQFYIEEYQKPVPGYNCEWGELERLVDLNFVEFSKQRPGTPGNLMDHYIYVGFQFRPYTITYKGEKYVSGAQKLWTSDGRLVFRNIQYDESCGGIVGGCHLFKEDVTIEHEHDGSIRRLVWQSYEKAWWGWRKHNDKVVCE